MATGDLVSVTCIQKHVNVNLPQPFLSLTVAFTGCAHAGPNFSAFDCCVLARFLIAWMSVFLDEFLFNLMFKISAVYRVYLFSDFMP